MWNTRDFGKTISKELNQKRNSYVYIVKTAMEVIMTSKNKRYSDNFLLNMSKWISNPTFSCNEFQTMKDTIFIIIASEKKFIKYHHNNLKQVIQKNQSEENEDLIFDSEIIQMFDGVRMIENISINNVALTCIAMRNCIKVYHLHQKRKH